MDPVWWWLTAGVLCFIIEIFTPGFFAASLGIGAFGTALVALLDTSLELQLLTFSILSLVSIFVLRPVITKYFYQAANVRTNADALIGRTGLVIREIDPTTNQGRMRIDGDEWQFSLAHQGAKVRIGETLRVLNRESIVLIVEPLNP